MSKDFKIYTKTGDDGTTGLVGGSRVRKSNFRLEAYGTIDELNSWIGLIRSVIGNTEVVQILL
ncbi:MAG TPA: ATP:cob(I)alamin adenosyltransferase, partial [Prolixibacteraceae bacterium]|nr:ATP:cob(I)alamin adenosyltransferase [Prolixibacteraceae bacterium]